MTRLERFLNTFTLDGVVTSVMKKGNFSASVEYSYNHTPLGRCSYRVLPGCGPVIITHGSEIYPDFRGQGWGTKLHKARLAAFYDAEFRVALCTVRQDNEPERRILQRFGWVEGVKFFNPQTRHDVSMWTKELLGEG